MAKILVIEDDQHMCQGIADILEMENYEVTQAKDGLDGLERTNAEKPDLIICDLIMPRMDGHEFNVQLRQIVELAAIPVIFMTNQVRSPIMSGMLTLDSNEYLVKPIDPQELLDMVRRRLKLKD